MCPGGAQRPDRARFAPAALTALLVVAAMVTVTPWLFGGVQARVQVWLAAGAVAALACWLLSRLAIRSADAPLPTVVVPLICVLGLGAFQLVPLDARSLAVFSPRGAELRGELAGGQPSSEDSLAERVDVAAGGSRKPLSLYPASTRRDLALLVLAVSVFFLGAVTLRSPRALVWLCVLMAANGAALAFFGLVQALTWNGKLYWRVPLTHGGGPFGPLVNHNNAGGYLGLCLAGALGMAAYCILRIPPRLGGNEFPPPFRLPHSPDCCRPRLPVRAWRHGVRLAAGLDAPTIAALSLVALILAGIVCSMSRGSWLATVGATIVTVLVASRARRRRLQLWWLGLAMAAGLALVAWVGMSHSVRARFATLLDRQTLSQARIPHWRDGLAAAPDFWRAGSGLGTYRYLYGLYQERLDELWYYHAENQYIEAAVEGGIPALGLILATIALLGAAAWQLLRHDPTPQGMAFGVAGVFALSGQAIHALFDFALYVPANVVLLALFCGSLSGRAAVLARRGPWPGLFRLPRFAALPAMLATLLLAGGVWGLLETSRVAVVETALRSSRLPQTSAATTPEQLHSAARCLAAALEHREDDAEAQYRMARLWIDLYRVRAFDQLRNENAAAEDGSLWQLTSPAVLHRRTHELAGQHASAQLERLRGEPAVRDHLVHALKHLVLAGRACPLLPEVQLMTAALSGLVAEPAEDSAYLERVRQLAPADPDLLYQCGVLELDAGRWERACQCWRRSLTLCPRHLDEVLDLAAGRIAQPETTASLLPDSPPLLIQLARERYQGAEHADVRWALLGRADVLIEQLDLPQDERCYLRASALALREQYPEAIASYSQAVALRLQEPRWRYELALALRREGMLGDAWQQARFCVRMEPDRREYRTLLEELNHTRLTILPGSPE